MVEVLCEACDDCVKIQEVISFRQSKWFEKYIDFNTRKRNKTKNDFEKIFKNC